MPSTSLYFSDDLLAAIDKVRGYEPRSSFVRRLLTAELAKTRAREYEQASGMKPGSISDDEAKALYGLDAR